MKEFYAEREHKLNPNDFGSIRYAFLQIYNQFLDNGYFAKKRFPWAFYPNIDLFFQQQLGLEDIWPFEEKIETYDEVKLFTVIEFLYEAAFSDTITELSEDLKRGKTSYRININKTLRFYNGGYNLSEDGKIQKLSPPGFEPLIAETVETNDPKNIDSSLKDAISKFSRYNSSLEDKKTAIIKLSGVLESLQKRGIKLYTDDDKALFHIMNQFNIRHNTPWQHNEYNTDIWHDWIFYTYLASVHLLLKLNDKRFNLKIQHKE